MLTENTSQQVTNKELFFHFFPIGLESQQQLLKYVPPAEMLIPLRKACRNGYSHSKLCGCFL